MFKPKFNEGKIAVMLVETMKKVVSIEGKVRGTKFVRNDLENMVKGYGAGVIAMSDNVDGFNVNSLGDATKYGLAEIDSILKDSPHSSSGSFSGEGEKEIIEAMTRVSELYVKEIKDCKQPKVTKDQIHMLLKGFCAGLIFKGSTNPVTLGGCTAIVMGKVDEILKAK